MTPLDDAGGGAYRAVLPEAHNAMVRLCTNATEYGVCNWAVSADDSNPYCCSCRLNTKIPDPNDPEALDAWAHIEAAKRRLIYTLNNLELPVEPKWLDPRGLAFSFEKPRPGQPVFTGHNYGLITINVDEADDPFREKQRLLMGEAYRTLLGHFRHEIGHYYWSRLVEDTGHIAEFRDLFGDERLDYAGALGTHYEQGPPSDWHKHYVSSYATMHPWEDWAECFAHYLHIVDTLETAQAGGLALRLEADALELGALHLDNFDDMIGAWFPLTVALNNVNRSMGQPDLYPFVLPDAVVNKLRFIHDIVSKAEAAPGCGVVAVA